MNSSAQGRSDLASRCNRLAHAALPSDYALLKNADIADGHPWAFLPEIALSDPGSVAYYRYLYGLARLLNPTHVLEIGTAFGLGSAAIIQGAPGLRKLISLDLGVFTRQYKIVEESHGAGWPVMERYRQEELVSDGQNIEFARGALERLAHRIRPEAEIRLYRVNTQPEGSDNFDARIDVPRWFEVPELVTELERTPIDLLFIDGKHTGDGLYQDFRSFFPFVRPGGIILCDDIHDSSYPYAWAGQTLASFERATAEFADDIAETLIWPLPQLPDWYDQEPIARPFGLVRKRGGEDGGAAPLDQGSLVLTELEGLESNGPLLRQLLLLHHHPATLAELVALAQSDDDTAAFLRALRQCPDLQMLLRDEVGFLRTLGERPELLDLLRDRPMAAAFLARRPRLAADLAAFEHRAQPSHWRHLSLLVFLFRRSLSRLWRRRE